MHGGLPLAANAYFIGKLDVLRNNRMTKFILFMVSTIRGGTYQIQMHRTTTTRVLQLHLLMLTPANIKPKISGRAVALIECSQCPLKDLHGSTARRVSTSMPRAHIHQRHEDTERQIYHTSQLLGSAGKSSPRCYPELMYVWIHWRKDPSTTASE